MPSGLCEDTDGEATALIARMGRGDGRALEDLFGMWGPVFHGISLRILGDPKDAAKAVRESFVRMWQRASDFDPHQAPPFVWAFAILRERCITRLRRRKIKPPAASTQAIAQSNGIPEDPRVMPLDDWRRLRSALESLPPDERTSLENAVFLGYARSAASSGPESPSSAVKTCLRRALDKIRNDLSRYEL
jgi:RNA polymerase sigma-70 factor (ECF subfamily)